MTRALQAEWTKLRTVPLPGWLLLAAVALTTAVGIMADAAARCQDVTCQLDPARVSLTGIYLSQAVVAIVAVLAISGEYTTGMIRVSLTAMPRRLTVLAAKAAVVTAPVLVAAVLGVLGAVLAGQFILPGRGFTAAHGYPAISLGQGPLLRAAAGSVLYLALIALLSLGVAAAVRDAAVAIGTVLGLLFVLPIIATVVGASSWHRHLEQIAPMTAGLAVQYTTGTAPIAPWAGLGVLAAWAAAALLAGGLLLCRKDA
jgi:ABC-2 type transport system permease protein